MYPGAMPGLASPWEADRQKQIDRTRTGILLLLIGALISWIPRIGALGGLLTLIGAILVILGRKAFGMAHRRNVVLSIVLFFVGVVILIFGAVAAALVAFGGLSPSMTEAQLTVALDNAFRNILIIAAIGSLVSGLGSVFFTFALQKREGQMVLLAAYGSKVGIEIAVLLVALPFLSAAAATIAHQIVTTGTVNPVEISNAVSGATSGVELLNVVPALLYAAANYFVWTRIKKGEIPTPAMPMAPPPMAPAPLPPR